MKKLFTACILFCATATTFAQKGFLRGQIIDAETGEALIGATVSEEGTTTGTVADFNGNYSLTLEPGVHTIVYQFVSYQTKTVSGVEIKAGEATTLDITLSSAVTELEGVVITAEQAKDTEVALLTLQKKSANLVDGISSQTFRRVGDGDLSGAMKRVTGVSVQGGKYVYVRGLGDRYTKTTLNDMSIPGLDPDNNAVQMDLFPTSTVENVVVFKTFSPNLLGDFTGGIVNVETKEFPEEKTTKISLGVSYNPSMNLVNDYLSYEGGKLDFLAFDDGYRELPIDKNTQIPNIVTNDPRIETMTRSFNTQLEADRQKSFVNTSFSFSHGNQINKDKVTLGYNAVLNYRNNYEYYDNVEFGFFLKNNDQTQNQLERYSRTQGALGKHDILWSALLSGALKFDNHSFSATVLRSQNGLSQASDRINQDFEQTGATLVEDILTYSQRSVTSGIVVGKHNFNGFELEWRNALTVSHIYEPDFKESKLSLRDDGTLIFDQGDGATIQRFYRDLNEVNESFKVDATMPFAEVNKLKFGAIATLKNRDFEVLNYVFGNTNPNNFSGSPNDFLKSENIWTPETDEGTYVRGNFDPSSTFDARQNVYGAYAMTEMNLTQKLKSIYGLRVEQAKMYYTGQDQLNQVYNDELTLDELDLLPSANLVYELREGMNVRGSYNRTLARPSFKEKSVAQIYDPISKTTFVGNIDLKETHIDNFDLRWEYFFTPGEMFSVSAFYKRFDGHIELTAFETAPDNLKPRNAGQSTVYGTEIEFRKNLGFISPAFANVSFGTNASFVRSAIDMKSVEVNNDGLTEYQVRQEVARAGEKIDDTREMAGQAPYLVNAFLNVTDNDNNLNVSLAYNVQGETLTIVGSRRVPDVYSRPFHSLNLNMYKDFGRNRNSRITIGVNNILNEKTENIYKSYHAEDQIYSIFRPGRTFSVKYGYTF